MSDVPELDKLLEEHKNFRHNIEWYRRDMYTYFFMRLNIGIVIVAPLAVICGPLVVLAVPFVWKLTERMVPKPVLRDPFRRYSAR